MLLVQLLQDQQLIGDELVVLNGNFVYVDQHLFDGNVSLAAQPQLYLHSLDQDLIHLLVLSVELPLLVVDTIQQILDIRHFRKIR